mgnify:FL=1
MTDGLQRRESEQEFIYRRLSEHLTQTLDELLTAVIAGEVSAGDIAKARKMLPKGCTNAFPEKA